MLEDNINKLSKADKKRVENFVEYLLFKSQNNIKENLKEVESFIYSKGYNSISALVKKIKDQPFNKTPSGYIYGGLLLAWMRTKLECPDEVSEKIFAVTEKMGLLGKNEFGNYG